ncbi:AAA family ATPase, partial [Acinetobacter baumannii]
MSNAIYIASSEPNCGKSVAVLGLMNMLAGKTKKVAYFKPIIHESPSVKKDIHI